MLHKLWEGNSGCIGGHGRVEVVRGDGGMGLVRDGGWDFD